MGLFRGLFGAKDGGKGPDWAPFFTAGRYRTFLEVLTGDLQRRKLTYKVGEGMVDVDLGGRRVSLGLANLCQVCHQSPEADWAGLVSGHLDSVLAMDEHGAMVQALSEQFDRAAPHLRTRLFPVDYPSQDLIWNEPAPGLRAYLCLDLPTTVATLNRETIAHWGMSDEELLQRGLRNVREHEPVERGTEIIEGVPVEFLTGSSFFASSHVLLLEHYLPPFAVHGALFAVPHRHTALIHPIVDLKAVEAVTRLLVMARGMFDQGPGSISPELYWWRASGIVHLPSALEDRTLSFRPPPEFIEVLNTLKAPLPS